MRVPLSWLNEYVEFELTPEELADRLTMAGMEVAAIERSGAEWSGVVVGRLLDVVPHPNAEKLTVTRVDPGSGEPLEIVCGATNIAAGQLVPVALPGATLSGGRSIGRSRIRGVESAGMLCSADELGLGTDADGILILGTGDEHRLGTDLRSVFGDVVLDVDVKPNRGDALSIFGLAREVAALTGSVARPPVANVPESGGAAAEGVSLDIQDPLLCPRFVARRFEGLHNEASPAWMQRRLVAAGMRPVSAVVDVTNYVMHELGQPMHAYDADRVPTGRIVVRRARDGEELETLDHVRRGLDPAMLVIADVERPIGLAGIMGGAGTEVTESTQRVILESAIFHGPTIRDTARRLALRSEAASRHEKGIDWNLPPVAADRAAQLIAEIAGGSVAVGVVDSDPEPRPPRRIQVDMARTERLLGLELEGAEAVRGALEPLGFEIALGASAAAIEVTVPSHRLDVVEPADVAEELARAMGYDRIAGRLPSAPLPPFRPDPSAGRHAVRRILAGLGLAEVIQFALISDDDLRRTGYRVPEERLIRVANPVSEEHALLRPVPYPSLLRALRDNVRQRRQSAWLFEMGKVYWREEGEPTPRAGRSETAGTGCYEAWEIGIVLNGPGTPRGVHAAERDADVDDLKGILDALHRSLGAASSRYVQESAGGPDLHPHLHPGRAARLVDRAGIAYGSIGELHPDVVAAWDLAGRPVVAALALDRLLDLAPPSLRAAPLPSAQPVDRDLAIVVANDLPVGELLEVVRSAAGKALVELRLFDVYRGEQIGPGRVSYALALRFQPSGVGDDRSVTRALAKVRGAVQHRLGAEIRE